MLIRTVFMLGLLATGNIVCAAVYHWIDTEGRRHYSDKPGPDHSTAKQPYQPQQPLQSIPAPGLPTLSPPTGSSKDRSRSKAKAKAKAKAKQQQAAARIERKCRGYRNKIDALTSKLRRGHSNKQGNDWRRKRRHYQQLHWQQC